MDDFFIERDLGPDIPMMSTGKILQTIRDGKSMKKAVSGRKRKQKHDLVIKSYERIDFDAQQYDDQVAGVYPFGGATLENGYELFLENGKIGMINIISKTEVVIETDHDEEWGNYSFIIVEQGGNKAYFVENL